MYLLIGLRKSTPQQTRPINMSISNNKQQVYDFVGEVTDSLKLVNKYIL